MTDEQAKAAERLRQEPQRWAFSDQRADVMLVLTALSEAEAKLAESERELDCRDALIKDHLQKILHLENRVDAEAARAEAAEARLREIEADRDRKAEALRDLVEIIDAAGLLNLSNGVQLGQTSWYVKAYERLEAARAALDAAPAACGQHTGTTRSCEDYPSECTPPAPAKGGTDAV